MDSYHLAKIILTMSPFEVLGEFGRSTNIAKTLHEVLAVKPSMPKRILPSEWAKRGKYAVGKEYNPKVGDDADFYDRNGDKRYGIITRITRDGNIWIEIRENGKMIETHQFEMVDDTI